MYMQNTYLFTHVASQNYVYFRIQWFSMNNWSKIQWSFHDFLIFTNFKNFFVKFNDFPMILKEILISMIFQELWEPCNELTWWHQAIMSTNVDLTSLRFCAIYHKAISQLMVKTPRIVIMTICHHWLYWKSKWQLLLPPETAKLAS